jgi:sugar O-acyltransferase (sialic acid O-acetyltransferase NeuD family)
MSAIIYGAGSYGEVYLDYLRTAGINVVGFLDDDISKHDKYIDNVRILGGDNFLGKARELGIDSLYCPIGNNAVRVKINNKARNFGLITPNFIHKTACVSSKLKPDSGIYVLPGSILMPFLDVQSDVMISMGVRVAHHSILEAGVFLSTGVSIGAGIRICSCSYIGMNAVLVTGKCFTVGPNSLVGAGAVVTKNVAQGITVIGNPARKMDR